MISPQRVPNVIASDGSLTNQRLAEVIAAASLDALRENQRFGLPFITMKDNQIVRMDSFEAEAELLRNFPSLVGRDARPGMIR